MRMKVLATVAALGLAPLLGGCNVQIDEQFVERTVIAIKAGVAVAAAATLHAIDQVCDQQVAINAATITAISIAQSRGSGPKTERFVNNANAAMRALNEGCLKRQTATGPQIAQVFLTVYTAYRAAKNAQAEASTI